MTKCYFLLYRVPDESGRSIDWNNPTGGLVTATEDKEHAMDIARARYHLGPHEEMVLAEVWGVAEAAQAYKLHLAWDQEMNSFLELMKA